MVSEIFLTNVVLSPQIFLNVEACSTIKKTSYHLTDHLWFIWFNFGWGYGLLPDGSKPLPKVKLANRQWSPVVFTWRQLHRKSGRYQSLECVQKLHLNCPNIFQRPVSHFINDFIRYIESRYYWSTPLNVHVWNLHDYCPQLLLLCLVRAGIVDLNRYLHCH